MKKKIFKKKKTLEGKISKTISGLGREGPIYNSPRL